MATDEVPFIKHDIGRKACRGRTYRLPLELKRFAASSRFQYHRWKMHIAQQIEDVSTRRTVSIRLEGNHG
jgi:hypothetical protein